MPIRDRHTATAAFYGGQIGVEDDATPATAADHPLMRRRLYILLAVALGAIAAAPGPAVAAYPGANGRIAFVRPDGLDTSRGDIWTVLPAGGSLLRLTSTGDNSEPTWSPDGRWIAFSSSRSGSEDIWVMRQDGSGLRRVTTASSNETDPTWSPDGRSLAFSSDRLTSDPRNRRSAIYRIRSTRPYGAAVQVTYPGPDDLGGFENDYAPVWASSGVIYFTRQFRWEDDAEPPWSSIYRVPSGGGREIDMLPSLGNSAWYEDVSPDGRRLAFSADHGSDGFFDPPMEIMVRDPGGAVRLLTPERLDATTQNPAWSPNGARIAYDRQMVDTGTTSVLTIRPDGTGAAIVVKNAVMPSWQPLPR